MPLSLLETTALQRLRFAYGGANEFFNSLLVDGSGLLWVLLVLAGSTQRKIQFFGDFMKLGKLALTSGTLLIVCSSLTFAQDSAHSMNFPDFSATQGMGNMGPGKVYQSGANFRAEPVPGLVVIYVAASNKLYNLYSRGNCIEMPPEKSTTVSTPLQLLVGTKVERTPAGTEVVDGHSCKVENVVVTGADGKTTHSKVWEAEDLKGAPVKIESQTEKGKVMAGYRDIVLGTPDAELFKPPSKCVPYDKMYQVAPAGK